MSVSHAQQHATDERIDRETADRDRRRADLDHDLVAILGMLAILVLTALCFLARTALPL